MVNPVAARALGDAQASTGSRPCGLSEPGSPPSRSSSGWGRRAPARRRLAHQGSREHRGRAAEPADRLRPRRRPQRHRRHAQQHPVHPAVAAGDAGAPRRQHPRPDAAHRQRRGRDGDRQSAGLRHAGHAHRRHRLGDGRLQEPAGRHAAGDAAARRRRQRLCGRARLGRDRRLLGRRRRREDHARRADRRPHLQWRDHRARDRFRAQSPAQPAARAAQRRLHHRQAHRRGDQRFHRHRRPPSRSTRRPCSSPSRSSSPATWSRC